MPNPEQPLLPFQAAEAEHWREQAQCRHADPGHFFPDDEDGPDADPAKQLCGICPVRQVCLDDAVLHRDFTGIRAGLSGRERRDINVEARTRYEPARVLAAMRGLRVHLSLTERHTLIRLAVLRGYPRTWLANRLTMTPDAAGRLLKKAAEIQAAVAAVSRTTLDRAA
ncbi:hypothetical protein BIV57_11315 [Mangrovactinospora gilvigrisea]|uniref:Transcriptional regulator WhiB n=1 Tax=Mangrovactinospora gilvigrisea TaxID=1428644 RepID=A0A1J7BFI2_9ACTN|nr:WhiB family transcriptional regulator [Mangrovactinospora gilvigrisea]OIV37398.1 hypothetical protein BIV57_11315 [Mangrovactinospora gilvigrisea]